MRRNVLVAGATGKQGQAVIRALLTPTPTPNKELYQSEESHQYHVFALTRKASSPSALLDSANQLLLWKGISIIQTP
jgi:uncharacterized protein YbjT (DUF2867 family)